MRIVVAMDKFKGSLSAPEAGEKVRQAILSVHPQAEVIVKPMADGGDGTARALIAARDGQWIAETVTGPLPSRPVAAGFGWFERDHSAVVEMATASGLALLKKEDLNPLLTTTYGTGELVAAALCRGARRLWLGVGGSATTDGGVGAAMAMGWRFLDVKGQPISLGGGELERIARVVPPPIPNPQSPTPIEVLCDVDNPLCGPRGAARVYGPQKGATPAMVERLDAGLRHLAEVVREQLGKEILDVPGAGAAGGLAAGALAFLNARLVPGIETVIAASGLDAALTGAAWVVTGEGRFDSQSLQGKVVSGVARLARKKGVRVAVLAGSVDLGEEDQHRAGIDVARASRTPGMTLDHALAQARELLFQTAREWAGSLPRS